MSQVPLARMHQCSKFMDSWHPKTAKSAKALFSMHVVATELSFMWV